MLRSLLSKVHLQRVFLVSGTTHYSSLTASQPYAPFKLQALDSGEKLRVVWEDGRVSDFHARWLRHNCRCSKCWNPSSYQKIMSHRDLAGDRVTVQSTELVGSDQVALRWLTDDGKEHTGQLDMNWLRNHDYSEASLNELQERSRPNTRGRLSTVSYEEVIRSEPQGLWSWLCALNEYGVCLLTGVPTENNKVLELTEMIGPVLNTHYGTVFDVVHQPQALNLAYTTNFLPLHVDLVYLESPPGIQLLHCLRNDPQVDGGDSILLDGWAVAESMRQHYPSQFKTLSEVPATFDKMQNGRIALRYRKTHIVLDRDGEIVGFNWSPQNHGPLFIHEDEIEPYYKAYNILARLLEESQDKLYHLLQPGDLLTFNNRRFLHSRNAFVANGGVRHLQGAYVSSDDFKSKVKLVAKRVSPEHVVKSVMNGCSF